jgi:hypothetical protein
MRKNFAAVKNGKKAVKRPVNFRKWRVDCVGQISRVSRVSRVKQIETPGEDTRPTDRLWRFWMRSLVMDGPSMQAV